MNIVGRTKAFTGTPAQWDQICKRASGRRAYNHTRQVKAGERRLEAIKLWTQGGGRYGSQKRIARQLGVSEATVCRYLKKCKHPC